MVLKLIISTHICNFFILEFEALHVGLMEDNWMQGALDGGLDIPHSDKRFAGFKKDEKQLDAEVHRKYIFGGHVASYMTVEFFPLFSNFFRCFVYI